MPAPRVPAVLTVEGLPGALAHGGDLLLVVCHLYAEAAGLEEAALPQLLGDPLEHGSAQLLGVNRRFLGDAAAAMYVRAAEVA